MKQFAVPSNSEETMINPGIVSVKISKKQQASILASSLVLFVVALVLWKQQSLDIATVLMHNRIYECGNFHGFMQLASRFGMGFISLTYALALLLSYRDEELKLNRQLFHYILFAFAFGSISGDLLKELFVRARPAVQLAGQIYNSTVSDSFSFPSGHATKSLSLALPFVLVASNGNHTNRVLKIVILLSSILVCYSRIALQKHFPSDVLAGLAIALLAVVVGHWIANRVFRRRKIDEGKLHSSHLKICFVFVALAALLTVC